MIIPFPEDLWLQLHREKDTKMSKMAAVTFALWTSFSFIKTIEDYGESMFVLPQSLSPQSLQIFHYSYTYVLSI